MGDGKAQQAERRLVGQSGKPPGPLGAILREFGRADGALTLGELAGRLGIERSALDGMIRLLVRKGRLRRADGPGAGCAACGLRAACRAGDSGGSFGACYELPGTGC